MKKLVLMLIALFFSHAVMAQGVTTKVTNKTKCDVTVTMKCYDLCIVVGTKTMVISAGATSVPMTVTPCGPGNFIIFTVCWNIDPHICQNQLHLLLRHVALAPILIKYSTVRTVHR